MRYPKKNQKYLVINEICEGMYWKSLMCWIIPIAIGVIIRWIRKSRISKERLVRTHIDRYLTILWLAAGETFILLVFICYLMDIYFGYQEIQRKLPAYNV